MQEIFSVQVKIEDYLYEQQCYKAVIPISVV
jgi:hypothetical protein